jgi:hypothetical protein
LFEGQPEFIVATPQQENLQWCSPEFTTCIAFLLQFPITALREIRFLQLLKNDNVVNLLEICRTKGELFVCDM